MLFRKHIARQCAYCVYSGQAGEELLCRKKGFVEQDSACFRFRYDPLKRTPSRYQTKDFSRFDREDFSL